MLVKFGHTVLGALSRAVNWTKLFSSIHLKSTNKCTITCPGGAVVKNSPANAGDTNLIPGSGRSPGGGNGNPLQYSSLVGYSPWGRKESDFTGHPCMHQIYNQGVIPATKKTAWGNTLREDLEVLTERQCREWSWDILLPASLSHPTFWRCGLAWRDVQPIRYLELE